MSYYSRIMNKSNRSVSVTDIIQFDTGGKLGFYGTEPIVQPSGVDQEASGPITPLTIPDGCFTDWVFGDFVTGLIMISIMQQVEQFADDVRNLITQVKDTRDLTNALRTALVDLGLIKGSA